MKKREGGKNDLTDIKRSERGKNESWIMKTEKGRRKG